jgi:CRP/FNR family transcriptional regulator
MSLRFRVVPKRKRRNGGKSQKRRHEAFARPADLWLDRSIPEKRTAWSLPNWLTEGLESLSSPVSYAKDSVLFVEGQKPDGTFVLHKGQVKLSASSADGKSLIVGRAEAGDLLGLPPSVSGRAHELSAEVVKPVQCSFISRPALLKFLRSHGPAALEVSGILSEMYMSTFDQLRNLGLSASAAQRLARLLLDLSTDETLAKRRGKRLPLTHNEIAEIIGVSRETVTRLLARFKEEQLVRVDDSCLQILDREGLEQILAA